MRKNFNFKFSAQGPAGAARIIIGVLVALNLAAFYFVIRPPGGSPQELRAQAVNLTGELRQKRAVLDRTRVMVTKIQAGRQEGDRFLSQYFLPIGTAYSTVLAELIDLAKNAQMKPKESSYNLEPIEGSDTLDMMTISQNLEGKYPDLIHFVNELDKSQRLLIVESLQATPQTSGTLNITLKLQTYVREDAATP